MPARKRDSNSLSELDEEKAGEFFLTLSGCALVFGMPTQIASSFFSSQA